MHYIELKVVSRTYAPEADSSRKQMLQGCRISRTERPWYIRRQGIGPRIMLKIKIRLNISIKSDIMTGWNMGSRSLIRTITLKRGVIPIKNGNGTAYDGRGSGSMEARLESGESVQIREIYYGTQESSILLWKEK